jgi:hypothetical protein
MDSNKIYKCTARDCEASILEKVYTSDDFETEGGVIKCPNNNCECGLKPFEDEIQVGKSKKALYLLGGVFALALLIGTVFMFKGKGVSQVREQKITSNKNKVITDKASGKDTVVIEKTLPKDTVVIEKTIIKQTIIEGKNPVTTTKKSPLKTTTVSKPSKATQIKTFSGGSKYVGDMIKGQMHGLGTYTYGQRELISTHDSKNRYAEAGDYIVGQFECSKVVSGKLFDKNHNLKEVIIIGGTGCTP